MSLIHDFQKREYFIARVVFQAAFNYRELFFHPLHGFAKVNLVLSKDIFEPRLQVLRVIVHPPHQFLGHGQLI